MAVKPRIFPVADPEPDEPSTPMPSLLITIDPPVSWSGGDVDALELREPTVLEYMKAQSEVRQSGGGPDQYTKFQMSLICAVTGRPRAVIEKLPVRTFRKCWEYIESFLEDTPAETT